MGGVEKARDVLVELMPTCGSNLRLPEGVEEALVETTPTWCDVGAVDVGFISACGEKLGTKAHIVVLWGGGECKGAAAEEAIL